MIEVVAVILQVAFLALAFGLRTYLHWRKTGNPGFRAGGARSAAEAVGAGGITVAAVVSLVATLLFAMGSGVTLAPLDHAALQWGGALTAVVAVLLVLAAQSDMGASWRIGVDTTERTDLVTGGLFALTRNPIFLGMLAFWAAMIAAAPDLLSVVAFAVAFVSVEVQVRMVEEPYLRRTHGDAYARYAARTGRLVPGIGRLGAAQSPRG